MADYIFIGKNKISACFRLLNTGAFYIEKIKVYSLISHIPALFSSSTMADA